LPVLRAQYGSTPEVALVGVVFVKSMLMLTVQIATTLSVGSELAPVKSTLKWACALVLICYVVMVPDDRAPPALRSGPVFGGCKTRKLSTDAAVTGQGKRGWQSLISPILPDFASRD